MRRATILLVLLGTVVFFAAGGAAPALVGHSSAAAATGTTSVKGNYAFSASTHDAITGQEGAVVGTMVFDGIGGVSGVYSQNDRCSSPCGQQVVTRAPFTGTDVVHSDGSASLDICITLPGPETVRVLIEGAFSNALRNFRFIYTQIASPCSTGTLGQIPNVTSGTADKL